MCPLAHVHRCGCATSAQSPGRKLFLSFSVCVFSTRLLCWKSSVTAWRSVEWDYSSKSILCSGIAAWAPPTETIPHLFILPCMVSIYTSLQTMWTKLHAIVQILFYSNSVLLVSYFWFFFYYFQILHGSLLYLFFPKSHEQEVWDLFPEWKTLSWVLIYQWIQKVRVVFHGCVTLCVCILNFTYHLLLGHVTSVIKWYSQASWTASCYQNRLSHSTFPLCFHLIPGCTVFIRFCHWHELSASQFDSLSQDKSWGFFAKSLLIFLITS